ncbi:excinuclease ABC, A subunit [Pedobacter sp. BAL39]|uniref:excinuclease ABC subunit UvrA n=1 Tax=Pedobacter sp. BAL39 TaxID=391596 RepID=UPI0001559D3B|nr:excinuclease ABC subunit UvrA [Pedobacter sp. BAL39]EDM35506.1 excinuclease ABC, A subunit [Pedobacter sp. BAL39]
MSGKRKQEFNGFVKVRGARTHNLKEVDLEIPRDALVVFTGVSGSGKSSLAFGTLYAEAQRRYLESVSPYARRLFNQMAIPEVDEIEGLPPAVALQQQRGAVSTRSSVGSVTTLANLLRMLYSRAGDYPEGQQIIYAEGFSANTPEGACPECHGLGRVYEVTEASMVPEDSLTIRERAIAAWPSAWGGQNQRDILTSMGYDVDIPWRDLPKETREWILFTDEQPVLPVYPGLNLRETQQAIARKQQPDYMGTFSGVRRHVMHTFANTQSALMKKRVAQYMLSSDCPLCRGKRLQQKSLAVKFAGLDIAEMSRLSLAELESVFAPYSGVASKKGEEHPEKIMVTQRIAEDLLARLQVMLDLGLGYLTLERTTPTLSPGELQRLRLATQVRSNLFGVVYVLDEPSAGLHPADTEALLRALGRLKASGNSLFVVEHEVDVIRKADWIVDVGPAAGEAGGNILYSGPPEGLRQVAQSLTRQYIYDDRPGIYSTPRIPKGWLKLTGVSRNNLQNLEVSFPIGVFTSVSGISGSGKSSLVSQVLVELVAAQLGLSLDKGAEAEEDLLEQEVVVTSGGHIVTGMELIKRLVVVDQKPIGRTPRSNLATYTGLFDHVRKLFAQSPLARSRKYDAGRFSFNVVKGRCANCEGEGFVMVELLFLPSVYAPCPSCQGSRYNPQTLEVRYQGKNIAEVLAMTVDEAWEFFAEAAQIHHALNVIRQVGLGYLRLGQSATELSGGEAQRIKLATELQRTQHGNTLYILDEPTTGLHPSDVEKLMVQLEGLVEAGNTVVVVEHDMEVLAQSDWIIDVGPLAGMNGGKIVAAGTPEMLLKAKESLTAPFLAKHLHRSI